MKTLLFAAILGLSLSGASSGANAQAANVKAKPAATAAKKTQPDVIFVPTPAPVVKAMLDMAGLRDGDVLYDLGSGDGRIPIAAVQRAKLQKAVGVDIDPKRIAEAQANATKQGVADKVTFRQDDLFTTDFADASVVTLYLLPVLNEKLRPRLLKELKPGTRVVSHAFDMGDWKPVKKRDVGGSTVYMWIIPENGGGAKGAR